MLAMVCFAAWHYSHYNSFSALSLRHLPRSVRRYFAARPVPSPRMANMPKLYLWAWERPEDLQFLPDKKVGVAFLAKTISLSPPASAAKNGFAPTTESPPCDSTSTLSPVATLECGSILIRPRMQPLRITPGTPLTAVVRIETDRGSVPAKTESTTAHVPAFSKSQLGITAAEIASAAQITGVTAVQIDFDATLSEHAFYRDLLIEVRRKLPPNFPLSITALASWCIGDRWLTELPLDTIDEAVPMLFRLGPDAREVIHYLSNGDSFIVPVCSGSLGLSTDEPFSRHILSGNGSESGLDSKQARIYIYSPKAWNSEALKSLFEEVETWHEN